MKGFLLLLAEITAVVLIIRWLYFSFVMPAKLSKYTWYTEYYQLCDYIKQVQSHEELEFALDAFYKFSANKEEKHNPDYKYAIRRVVILLKTKYMLFKNKTVIA